jgi:hypothetical protein
MSSSKSPKLLMVRVRADLNSDDERMTLYGWLDRWRHSIASCSRTGGVWEERFSVVVPKDAVGELPENLITAIASPLEH